MNEHALNSGAFKQIAIIFSLYIDGMGLFRDKEREIKFRGRRTKIKLRDLQTGKRHCCIRHVLEGKKDLEERRIAQRTLGLKFIYQAFEGKVLVSISIKADLPHAA